MWARERRAWASGGEAPASPGLIHTLRRTTLGPQDASTSSPLGVARAAVVVSTPLGMREELARAGGTPPGHGRGSFAVESRTGASALGSGGLSVAFAPGLSPAPVATFPVPAHRTVHADFPHTALGRDHAFAHGKRVVRGPRRIRPCRVHSRSYPRRTGFRVSALCLRHRHWSSRLSACLSIAA